MKTRAVLAFAIFAIVLTLPFWVSAVGGETLKPVAKPQLELPAGKCVADTEYMIANHPNLLKEARERTVRDNLRNTEFDKKYSLKGCFKCHTDRSEFCDKCHNYAGVKPGCFTDADGCHYTKD